MKKVPGKRLTALLLCAGMLFLTACGGDVGPQGQSAMGRYVEEELSFPREFVSVVTMREFDDGSIWILGMEATEDENGEFEPLSSVWSTKDFGDTWQEENFDWLNDIPYDMYINNASILDKDKILIYGNTYSEYDSDEEVGSVSGFWEGDITHHFFLGDRNSLRELNNSFVDKLTGYGISEFKHIPGGGVLVNDYRSIVKMDEELEKIQFEYPVEYVSMWGSYDVRGNLLAIMQEGKVEIYNLETDELVRELNLPASSTMGDNQKFTNYPTDLKVISLRDEALYFADASGIYRMTLDNGVSERLLDGALCSLGLPTINLYDLFTDPEEERFLTLSYMDVAGFSLHRYTYDPNVASVPSTELKVYSLYDNQTVRQAIGKFQQNNPDVRVNFEVGVTGSDGVTAADALRTLSNEMLAGKGPDVLILDGMPVESYIQKNMLQDLSDILFDQINSGELLQSIARTFQNDSGLHAVPARFSVPMILGLDDGAITDLDSLVTWLEGETVQNIGLSVGRLVEQFYDASAHRWFAEDGSMHEENLRKDLANLYKIAEMIRDMEARDIEYYEIGDSLLSAAMFIHGNMMKAGIATVSETWELVAGSAIIDTTGYARLFPGEGVYVPSTILGVTTTTRNDKIAKDFLLYILSEENLRNAFNDGFPVNMAALDDQMTLSDPTTATGAVGMSMMDGESEEIVTLYLEYEWPGDEVMGTYANMLKSLTTPSFSSAVAKEILFEETIDYMNGDKSLDDTMETLRSKLDIYLAE